MEKYFTPEMDVESLANDVVTASGEPTDTPEPTYLHGFVPYGLIYERIKKTV